MHPAQREGARGRGQSSHWLSTACSTWGGLSVSGLACDLNRKVAGLTIRAWTETTTVPMTLALAPCLVYLSGFLPESTTLSAPNVFVIRFVLSEELLEK
jgi:hypothetical protein